MHFSVSKVVEHRPVFIPIMSTLCRCASSLSLDLSTGAVCFLLWPLFYLLLVVKGFNHAAYKNQN